MGKKEVWSNKLLFFGTQPENSYLECLISVFTRIATIRIMLARILKDKGTTIIMYHEKITVFKSTHLPVSDPGDRNTLDRS